MFITDKKIIDTFTVFIGIILLCILVGKAITVFPYYVPIVFVAGIFIFLLAFVNMDVALIILIYSMLLSPEISIGAVSHRREIVIRIEDLLIVALSLAWIAKSALTRNTSLIANTPINKFIGLYCIICLISTVKGMLVGGLAPLRGFFYLLKYVEYFLIYYLVCGVLKRKIQLVRFLKAFIITFLIVNIYAFTQIGTGRVSAPFEGPVGEPNTLGGYQILMFAIIIGLLTNLHSIWIRWGLAGLSVFAFIPFVNTLSRSSYMAIIPMYFSLIFFNRARKRNILIGVLIIATLLSMFFFPQKVKERIKYTFVPQEQEAIKPIVFMGITLGPSASARIRDWERKFRDWQKKPFLGYGITGRGFLDSQFIRTLVELGLIGLMAFVLLLGAIFKNTLKIYRRTNDELLKGLALGFLAGHIGMIFHALTANTYILIRIMEPYWFLAAMVMSIPKIEAEENEQNTSTERNDLQNKDKEPHQLKVETDKKSYKYLRNSVFLLR